MEFNPNFLEQNCKEALLLILKPYYLYLLHPWMKSSTDKQKKLIVDLKAFIFDRDYIYDYKPLQQTVDGLYRDKNIKLLSLDGYTKGHLDEKRTHRQVALDFDLQTTPLSKLPYSCILQPQIIKRLEKWQAIENTPQITMDISRVLDSLLKLSIALPSYKIMSKQLLDNEPHERLFMDSKWRQTPNLMTVAGPEEPQLASQQHNKHKLGIAVSDEHTNKTLKSHISGFRFATDYTSTYMASHRPPPKDFEKIRNPIVCSEIQATLDSSISPHIIYQKLGY